MQLMPGCLRAVVISALLVFFALAAGLSGAAEPDNLETLSLDQLMDIDVISVAKVPEKIKNTPAAIQVITQEDIRRSGMDTVPELLRLVPGVQIYRIDGNKWAISARGFASQFANKMLVMIDGRTVYSPLFSGVYWDIQDLILADIDRIEVIRGPGGSLWGTNAVNGIINIITKESADTQGGRLEAGAGNYNHGTYSARYGGWLDEYTSYRIYGKYFSRDALDENDLTEHHQMPGISSAHDEWRAGRGGFRLDRDRGDDKFTLQGDIYNGNSHQTGARPNLNPPFLVARSEETDLRGGNLLGRWHHLFSRSSDIAIQVYYDRSERDADFLHQTLDTVDLDLQHRLVPVTGHELLWGIGYRYLKDKTHAFYPPDNFYLTRFDPASQKRSLYTGFLQDRISFAGGRGELTLGTKIEHNEYTGTEWQPSLRLLWKLTPQTSLWGAVTRSIRTPSRLEEEGNANLRPVPLPGPAQSILVPKLTGNHDLDSEQVLTYELGLKSRPLDSLYFDITAFYNRYHDLIAGFVLNPPRPVKFGSNSPMVLPMTLGNHYDANTWGVEINGNWLVTDWWRLTSGFTWFDYSYSSHGDIYDPRQNFQENNQSKYQASLLSYMDLPGNFEINSMIFYVDRLDRMDIDSYTRLDLNLAWHATADLTFTLGARNLLERNHTEYDNISEGVVGSDIPRNYYGKISWSF